MADRRHSLKAEALHAYTSARTVINQEWGIEPCRALEYLHRSILASDVHVDVDREPSRDAQ
ncbi:BTAD domain-containing putative transcriptional regulator [Saccharopolyspora sp. NFXS83]|uniref:BTAD domain-containing putative transcriptional regulator n=1 Tax=Saccharopolyspora sp. NFXS83 TaxID=2993560 RepID=UPI00224B7CF6|nr:BTAD domain-containing putative transcriptional regulator [Saccharopolyspora sp. NFXS83]MCX2730622.1 BTAD domain-containing putative transcriptional regulator [Saccharopolyspora sp. NFXS83]